MSGDDATPPRELHLDRPGWARIENYLQDGKDHYAADRTVADEIMTGYAGLRRLIAAQRHFLMRAVRFQAAELGIGQFLEFGAGLPSVANVHGIAQDVDPAARVVYVCEEAHVAAHARVLLCSTTPGRIGVIEADLRKPRMVLDDPVLADTLDLDAPVGLLLGSTLACVLDEVAHEIVCTLLDALPAGSAVTITHPTADFDPDIARATVIADRAGLVFLPRGRGQVGEFFAGLDLVEPGIVPLLGWRPETHLQRQRSPHAIDSWVGLALKSAGPSGGVSN